MKSELRLDGLDGMRENVERITGKRLTQIIKSGVNYAVTPMVQAAKRNLKPNSGLTRKAMTKTVRVYASGTVVAVVGPDYQMTGNVVFKGRKSPRFHRPAKIAHIIEHGHRIAKGGKLARKVNVLGKPVNLASVGLHVGDVPPRPFLQPAFDSTKDQVTQRLADKVRTGIAAELSK